MESAVNYLAKGINAFFLLVYYIINKSIDIGIFIIDLLQDFDTFSSFKFRKYTQPWSWVFPITHKLLINRQTKRIPLLRPGVQFVRGMTGGGKSLTSFILAEMTLEATGHPSYFTSAVEKPRLTEDGKFWYVFHPVINLKDYYQDYKKVKRYNTKLFKNIHKDERHLDYNPRENKSKEYNKTFIPEHADELIMRHQGFDTIYKYSQHIKMDGQDMETIDLMHEVETIKDLTIKQWVRDGKYNYIPVKIKIHSYQLYINFDGTTGRTLFKKWYLPVPFEVLQRYDTYAEKNRDLHLPLDFK